LVSRNQSRKLNKITATFEHIEISKIFALNFVKPNSRLIELRINRVARVVQRRESVNPISPSFGFILIKDQFQLLLSAQPRAASPLIRS
jgi:hypothetical protein